MELNKLIVELVLRFDLSLAGPNQDWTVHDDRFVKPHDLWVRPRSTDLFCNVWFVTSRSISTKIEIATLKTEALLKGSNCFTLRCLFLVWTRQICTISSFTTSPRFGPTSHAGVTLHHGFE